MNISPITQYQANYKYKPYFTSCTRIYNPKEITDKDIFSKNNVRTTSNIFRYDQDWNLLMKYILWNFLNKSKVNIYSFACSDGSEPYTYALYLHNKTPKSYYEKFTPILACDIDPEIIKTAKSGKINLDKYDFNNMKKYIKNPDQYFKKIGKPIRIKNNISDGESSYKIDPEIREMVKFKQSDILTELKKIQDDGNSVINIRNVFPYLKPEHTDEILQTLSEKLQSGSIFVFGNYDHRIPNFRQHLHDLGFYSPIANANFVQKI